MGSPSRIALIGRMDGRKKGGRKEVRKKRRKKEEEKEGVKILTKSHSFNQIIF